MSENVAALRGGEVPDGISRAAVAARDARVREMAEARSESPIPVKLKAAFAPQMTCISNLRRFGDLDARNYRRHRTSNADSQMASWDIEMLRLGNRIRLTRREIERFTKITGMEPVDVKTLDDVDDYIQRCKAHFSGVSESTRFLHFLLDEERSSCVGAA